MNNTNKRFVVPGIIGIVVLGSLNFSGRGAEPVAIKENPVKREVLEMQPLPDFNLQPASVSEPKKLLITDESTILTPEDIKSLLIISGFKGEALRIAFGIIMKESTGRPYAHNQNSNTGDNSYGLFQINMIGSLGPARREQFGLKDNEDLFNPLTNAAVAYIISDGGNDWGPWGGVSRKVLNFMNDFPE
jgi:hypothetical protein